MNKAIALAERLARNVVPDLGNRPLYVVQPRDDGRISSATIGGSKGLFFPDLDSVMRPELEALGEWRGPGVCLVLDAEAFYREGLSEFETERKIVGVILHELCHWLDKPERKEIASTAEAFNRFTEVWGSPPKRKPQFPVPLLAHPDTFQRLAVHVLYRCNHGGGYCLSPRRLAISSTYAGLEYLPDPQEFVGTLDQEVRELVDLPLREIAARKQPTAFIQLWDRVLSRYISSPTHNLTNGENNHAESRSKKTSRRSAQLTTACHPRRCPADHFRNKVLEAGRRHLVMGFVHRGIRIQTVVSHDAVDEIIDYDSDAVNSAEALIEARLRWLCWHVAFSACVWLRCFPKLVAAELVISLILLQ